MYVTATLPYLFMIILLIRNCLLTGAGMGIEFYLTPNATKLADMQVNVIINVKLRQLQIILYIHTVYIFVIISSVKLFTINKYSAAKTYLAPKIEQIP